MRLYLRKIGLVLCVGALLALWSVVPAAAQFTAEQRQAIETIIRDYLMTNPDVMIDVLQAAQEKLKGEAREKAAVALAERRQEVFNDPNSPVTGNPNGDVTLVEFFDYRCPYCKQVLPSIDALLAEDKQLRFVYKELPVLGPESVTAARAALASRKQRKYDAMHRALMSMKGQINEAAVFKAAAAIGLDVEQLKRDMASPEIERMLQANSKLATELDIRGTPAFVVGDEIVPGAVSIDALRQLVEVARNSK